MVDLAIHSSQGHVNLKSISERCGISEAYILQIFLVLRRAGIVDSIRGAQGGYVLSRDPSEITVRDVLTALEGPLAPVECIVKDSKQTCGRFENCITREFWQDIAAILNEVAASITIKDLVQCYNDLSSQNTELEYYL